MLAPTDPLRSLCLITFVTPFLLMGRPALAQSTTGPTIGTITVHIDGCTSDAGHVRMGLATADAKFEADTDFREASVPVHDGTARHIFENIPYGTYAVRLYHDANDNEELDTNFMGIPKEAYGFSNNARGRFGLPSFDEAAFTLDADSLTLTIRVR